MGITHLTFLIIVCLGVPSSLSEYLHRQKRNWIISSFVIEEDYKGPFPYSLGKVEIDKELTSFRIEGQGVDKEPRDVLKIDEYTGEITVYKPVDYEKFQVLQLTFKAIDRTKNVVDTKLGIHVKILDANDNAPEFDRKLYEISVPESKLQGSDLLTVEAVDKDASDAFNLFDMRLISVEPKPEDLEFYFTQIPHFGVGTISFKGCLNYEKGSRYKLLIEAKDRANQNQMSSTCTVFINIVDGNNHLPVIIQQNGTTKVKEHISDVLIFSVSVSDEDVKGSVAWKAKYNIIGDKNQNFRISTDPKTNEGHLYVNKPLDYEDTEMVKLTITAENESPFYSCEVVDRSTSGLWKVLYHSEQDASDEEMARSLSSQHVSVMVEDANEAPILTDKTVHVTENVKEGKLLHIFTAEDPDLRSANTITYIKGEDPAGWIAVDGKSGKVATSAIIDRESPFVNNSLYIATIHAVDNGIPPMTGTGTITIRITDENDNTPFLVSNSVDVCHSDQLSRTSITASDLDMDPNAGPFHFYLNGDVKGKWRVNPSNGYSVDLIKESRVPSGIYDLSLEVSDLQGASDTLSLTVTVCKCVDETKPNCHLPKNSSTLGAAGIGILFLSLLLLACLLLVTFLFTCKKDKIPISDDTSGHLMISNTETPGEDCTVSFASNLKATPQAQTAAVNSSYMSGFSQTDSAFQPQTDTFQWDTSVGSKINRGNSLRMSMGARPMRRTASTRSSMIQQQQLQKVHLNKALKDLQFPGNELFDYAPHVYADEGTLQRNYDLDDISISEVSFNLDSELDLKFRKLASLCMPSATSALTSD